MVKTPKMTRAHFKYLAALMAVSRPCPTLLAEYDQWLRSVEEMAIALSWTNDTFDKAKFVTACGAV